MDYATRRAIQEESNYRSDRRVRAGERAERTKISEDGRHIVMTLACDENGKPFDDYEEQEHLLPLVYQVCPTCDGHGKHVNPSIDAGGLSAEDFYEDPDFAEEYRSGRYDVTCYGCGGRNVIPVVDRDKVKPEVLKFMDEYEAECAEFRRMQDAERRMGA